MSEKNNKNPIFIYVIKLNITTKHNLNCCTKKLACYANIAFAILYTYDQNLRMLLNPNGWKIAVSYIMCYKRVWVPTYI